MLTADAEFRAAANAAFAAWQNQPPYIAYRVDVTLDIPAMKQHQVIARAVEARTRDDRAVLQDLPRGANQLGHSFPVPPTFDALSYFHIDFHLGDALRLHNPLTAVTMLPAVPGTVPQPLRYADPAPSSADVVVTSLRNYHAAYAPDSNDRIAHITLQALPTLTAGNDSTFYLSDVYVDLASNLPTRIVYAGPTTDFTVDYTMAGGYWLINHAFYRNTIVAPLHLGQTTWTADATYRDFTFPAQPRDDRLR